MSHNDSVPAPATPSLPLWSYKLQRDSRLLVRRRQDVELRIIARALRDDTYRDQLLTDPTGVIEAELGTPLPASLHVTVVEETDTDLYIVLPANPYEGVTPEALARSIGVTYEDVAYWVLQHQRNVLLDEVGSVALMVRAWTDEEFRSELLRNPVPVLERFLGEPIKESIQSVTVHVLQETGDTLFLVLPPGRVPEIKPDDIPLATNLLMVAATPATCCFLGGTDCQSS